jgi:CP family cyanate transporter-like MFS transporter
MALEEQSTDPAARGAERRAAAIPIGWALAIMLVAANLRPALVSVSPLLATIQRSLHLSAAGSTALTTDPVLCFGLLAPLAPLLARRLGLRGALLAAMAALAAGMLLRLGPSALTLFAGTTIAGGAIATGNVLLPALVKRDFVNRAGLMTGLYVTALSGAASLAAGITVPLETAIGLGWRGGLAPWAMLALAGLLVWGVQMARVRDRGPRPQAEPAQPPPARVRALLRDRLAWQVTAFMGLQSLGYYAVLSWLPTIFQDHGLSAGASGTLLATANILGTVVSLLIPTLATARSDQRLLVAGVVAVTATGLAGLLLLPTGAPYLWAALIGLGQGAAFPLALTLLVLRTRGPQDTAALSTLAQSVGYVIAAFGPLMAGALHATTHSWTASIVVLIALLVPELLTGLAAGRPGFVEPST